MKDFNDHMSDRQVTWRQANIAEKELGKQNNLERPWIMPWNAWPQGLWPGVRDQLTRYVQDYEIEVHKGVHNLKSSWILCANLYFPFRQPHGLPLLAGFLRERVSETIESVECVELEYAEAPPLDPQTLLGEPEGGTRGANQTSPDIAFIVRTAHGRGLILTENKLVEHSFYSCSGRKKSVDNPDSKRCLDWQAVQNDTASNCWQMQWEKGRRKNRRYWDHIRLSDHAQQHLTRCPAATAGYQLFRQQALAEGIAASDRYNLVASCVAYDARNDGLIHCLRRTGVDNFSTGWGSLFGGKALFSAWTHQQWVSYVREHDGMGEWADWLAYIEDRYGYTEAAR